MKSFIPIVILSRSFSEMNTVFSVFCAQGCSILRNRTSLDSALAILFDRDYLKDKENLEVMNNGTAQSRKAKES
jgi:hypothetical protein